MYPNTLSIHLTIGHFDVDLTLAPTPVPAARRIVNDGGSIIDVSVKESDLEEIFLRLVDIEE